jgi:hypothetical protein
MKILSLIHEPDVIERILRHLRVVEAASRPSSEKSENT